MDSEEEALDVNPAFACADKDLDFGESSSDDGTESYNEDGLDEDESLAQQRSAARNSSQRCVYLLVSESPARASKGRTYIGFTVDPARRLRQHNGELKAGGARKTSRHRPWRMIMLVTGFADRLQALQFEWAWQNPQKTRKLKASQKHCTCLSQSEAAASPVLAETAKSSAPTGCAEPRRVMARQKELQLILASLAELLRAPSWSCVPLSVRFAGIEMRQQLCALTREPVPLVPAGVLVADALDAFRCERAHWELLDCELACTLCERSALGESAEQPAFVRVPCCLRFAHVVCLARAQIGGSAAAATDAPALAPAAAAPTQLVPCAAHQLVCVFCGHQHFRWASIVRHRVALGPCACAPPRSVTARATSTSKAPQQQPQPSPREQNDVGPVGSGSAAATP